MASLYDLMIRVGIQDDASSQIEGLSSKTKSTFGTIGKVAATAFAAVSAGVVAFGTSAVRAGMSFDSAMSQVAATMGTTVDQIGELRDFAQEMGSTTAFSATQAAEALNYMALAGYDAETSMGMLPNVLNLAAAGNIELAAASDMVTDAQSALGLTLEETSVMVDQMAAASSKTNTSVEQLGSAILTIGGTARSVSGGTQELATALGLLADNGIKGSEGGTALRNVLNTLATDKFENVFGAMGIAAYDAEGNMRALKDIFLDMNDALSDMTVEERTKTISEVFNARDLKSINALLGTNAERWDEVSEAIGNSAGAAERMAATQLDNLQGDVTLFQSALEGLQIAFSDELTPTLREFVQFGSEGLSELTSALKEGGFEAFADKFADLVGQAFEKLNAMMPSFIDAGARILGALVSGLMQALPSLIQGLGSVIQSALSGIANAFPVLTPLFSGISAAIGFVVDNINLIAPAAIAAFAAFKLFQAVPGIVNLLPVSMNAALVAIVAVVVAVTAISSAFADAQRKEENFNGATNGLRTACSESLPSLEKAVGGIEGIGAAAQRTVVSIDELAESQSKLADSIAERNQEAQDDINALERAKDTIAEYAEKTDLSAQEQGQLQAAIDTVCEQCGIESEAIDIVNGTFTDQEGNVQDLTTAIDALIKKNQEQIRVDALESNLKDLYSQRSDAIAGVTTAYEKLLEATANRDAFEVGSEQWLALDEGVQRANADYERAIELQDSIDDSITGMNEALGATVEVSEGTADSVRQMVLGMDGISDAFRGCEDEMVPFAQAIEDAGFTIEDLSNIGTVEMSKMAAAWTSSSGDIIATMEAAGVEIPNKADLIVNSVVNSFNNGTSGTESAATASIQAYAQAINSGLPAEQAANVANRVASALNVPGTYSIGANAADGVASGINARAWSAMQAAQSLANSVASTLSSALQISSPSKVTKRIGQFVGQGLAIGMEEMEGEVSRAAELLAIAGTPSAPQVGATYPFGGAVASQYGQQTRIVNLYTTLDYNASDESVTLFQKFERDLEDYFALGA